jgi:GT2 family glycosyltransferase
MASLPLTSVVMVSFFTGPVLDQAIEAALASTAPVELILVDNGNPPEVTAALAARAEGDKRLTFITGHGNVGFSKGCNLGAKAAKGLFLLFLNPDSVLPKDAIMRLLTHAQKLKRPFMIGARLQDEHGHDQRGCRRAILTPIAAFVETFHLGASFPQHRLNLHQQPIPEHITPVPAISGAFMFVLAADFAFVKGFDEGYFLHVEDLDFCLRFRRAKGEIYFDPSVVVRHVGGTSTTTSLFLEEQKARGFVRYFHENFGHSYPQPVLWVLDAAIWGRFWVRRLLPRWHNWKDEKLRQLEAMRRGGVKTVLTAKRRKAARAAPKGKGEGGTPEEKKAPPATE